MSDEHHHLMASLESHPAYLGDGVYASFDDHQIWLRVDREGVVHEIALEPKVYEKLKAYGERLFNELLP